MEGSFSAVWIATIARKDAFFSIFRDLQDLHPLAPLQSQILQISDLCRVLYMTVVDDTRLSMSQINETQIRENSSTVQNGLAQGKNRMPKRYQHAPRSLELECKVISILSVV